MILSDTDIKAAIQQGAIKIDPKPEEDQFSSTALDLRLGSEFKVWNEEFAKTRGLTLAVDPSDPEFSFQAVGTQLTRNAPVEKDGAFTLQPRGAFVLGITHERVELPIDSLIAARVEGRSSLARLGLGIHITAPTIHAGFRGPITLEIVNHGVVPIRLVPVKLRACQLIFERVLTPPTTSLKSEFQDQSSVLGKVPHPDAER